MLVICLYKAVSVYSDDYIFYLKIWEITKAACLGQCYSLGLYTKMHSFLSTQNINFWD